MQREEGSRTRQIFGEGMAALGVKVHTALEIGSREGVREAVAQGLGLGAMHARVIHRVQKVTARQRVESDDVLSERVRHSRRGTFEECGAYVSASST